MNADDLISHTLADKARQAMMEELRRQVAERPKHLAVEGTGDLVQVNGEVDIDALAMVVIGAVAGGP